MLGISLRKLQEKTQTKTPIPETARDAQEGKEGPLLVLREAHPGATIRKEAGNRTCAWQDTRRHQSHALRWRLNRDREHVSKTKLIVPHL